MAMDACIIRPKGDPDGAHRYAIACCVKILKDAGYSIERETMRLLKVDTPAGKHDFLQEVEKDLKDS